MRTYLVEVTKTYTFAVDVNSKIDAQYLAYEEVEDHDADSVDAVVLEEYGKDE